MDVDKFIKELEQDEKRKQLPKYKIKKYALIAVAYLISFNFIFDKLEEVNQKRNELEIENKEMKEFNKKDLALLKEQNGIHFLHITKKDDNTVYLEGITSEIFIKVIIDGKNITYVDINNQKFDSHDIAFNTDLIKNDKYSINELIEIEEEHNNSILKK